MPTQPPKRARDRGASAEDEDDDDDVGSEDEYDDDDGDDDDEDGESGGAKGGGSAFNWRQFIDDEAEQSDDGIDGEDDDGDDEVRALHKHVPPPTRANTSQKYLTCLSFMFYTTVPEDNYCVNFRSATLR